MRIVLKMIIPSDDAHVENETELIRLERGHHSAQNPDKAG